MNKKDNVSSSTKARTARLIGADIAKIIAMTFVVAVHADGSGLSNDVMLDKGLAYRLFRGMAHALFVTCIDIFAIVSGYVGVATRFKVSRVVKLWLRVTFTCVSVTAITAICFGVDVSFEQWMRCFMPISGNQYWYITNYFMLMFVMPFVNVAIMHIDRHTLDLVLRVALSWICIPTMVGIKGGLGVAAGFSFAWLLVLYIVGAYMRIYSPFAKIRRATVCIIALCLMAIGGVIPLFVSERFFYGGYTSPITLGLSICIIELSLSIRFGSRWVKSCIAYLSGTSLAVYLVHNTPVFWNNVFLPLVKSIDAPDMKIWAIKLLWLIFVFYVAGTVFDSIRLAIVKGAMWIGKRI